MLLAGLLCVVLFSFGCERDSPERGRVVLVGLDGVSPRLVDYLMARGALPNFSRLAKAGVFGPLRSEGPLFSPRIWNSIATGKSPEKHGIEFFVTQRASGTGLRLFDSTDRRVHALWNIVSDAGLEVGVVNWWNTYPPEKINGAMVSDHVLPRAVAERTQMADESPEAATPCCFPISWENRVGLLIEREGPLTAFADPFADETVWPPLWQPKRLSHVFAEDDAIMRMAIDVDEQLQPDLLMVFLPGIDRVSHRLWGGFEIREGHEDAWPYGEAERRMAREALFEYYEYTDALLGQLIDRYGKNDLVMVVSDHGFESPHRPGIAENTGTHVSEEAIDGVLFARGPGVPHLRFEGGVSIYDVTPTILSWLGIPPALDMDGRSVAFLKSAPLKLVATHDVGSIDRLEAVPSGAEEEIIMQLRGLGYIE